MHLAFFWKIGLFSSTSVLAAPDAATQFFFSLSRAASTEVLEKGQMSQIFPKKKNAKCTLGLCPIMKLILTINSDSTHQE